MQTSGEQAIIGIIAGSIVFLMLGIFLFLFILYYRKRQNANIGEKALLKRQYEDNLVQTQMEVQEATRQKLAYDLHDNIGQILSLTNVTLGSIDLEQSEKARQKIEDARTLVSRSIKELRRLSKVLQGEQLIQQGLIEAIRQELEWLTKKGYYSITFEDLHGEKDFDKAELNLFIFRILQESLNNILKHAEADSIGIKLEYLSSMIHLTISDNGKGFEQETDPEKVTGMGLANMKKRAALMGGTIQIHSVKGNGTTLIFKLPYS